MTKMTDDFVY